MPKKLEKNASPTLQLIDFVWRKSFECKRHSWDGFNSTMRSTLNLAITSGMRFDLDDFQYIADNYRLGYWAYSEGANMYGEEYYSLAIIDNNFKAIQSFESWKNRKPFIFNNVTGGRYGYREMSLRKRSRIFARSTFKWKDEVVRVTSFSESGEYIIACSYMEKDPEIHSTNNVKKRYKITPKELLRESRWIKRCSVIESKLRLGHTYARWIVNLCDILVPEKKNRTRDRYFRMILGEK